MYRLTIIYTGLGKTCFHKWADIILLINGNAIFIQYVLYNSIIIVCVPYYHETICTYDLSQLHVTIEVQWCVVRTRK